MTWRPANSFRHRTKQDVLSIRHRLKGFCPHQTALKRQRGPELKVRFYKTRFKPSGPLASAIQSIAGVVSAIATDSLPCQVSIAGPRGTIASKLWLATRLVPRKALLGEGQPSRTHPFFQLGLDPLHPCCFVCRCCGSMMFEPTMAAEQHRRHRGRLFEGLQTPHRAGRAGRAIGLSRKHDWAA